MIGDNIEKQMSDQDEAARKSAEEYAKSQEPEKKGSWLDRLISPVVGFAERVSDRFDKNREDAESNDAKQAEETKDGKLIGGTSTAGESKIKGFSKKHVLIIGTVLTLVVVLGVAMGTHSPEKKEKKDDSDVNRGAITGQHMSTLPKDYTELASVKRRQQVEDERKKADGGVEKGQNEKRSTTSSVRDTRPVSEQARDARREVYTPPQRYYSSESQYSSEERPKDVALEAKLAREATLRQMRQEAMNSPIGFEIRKK